MVKKPPAAKPAKIQRQQAKRESGVAHVAAVHGIVYGNADKAPAGAIFQPYTKAEREELLRAGAARELNDQEALVLKSGGVPVAEVTSAAPIADPTPPADDEESVSDAEEDAAADESPLG